ncbi:TetR/AcrR family transcriptional regulator [Bradyrhizobium sp. YR681]|uniref:TetR/AcrR family transcriptional regulator n=1 Tax=Bradyrhizobium sp. YR681 TaxID=1144344 RepID=UPI000312A41A|nr:TetR/AcrR family transcriptional regulator [Bradyrhizobium sp. YR681]
MAAGSDTEKAAPTIGSKERRRKESDRRMLRAAVALIGRHGTSGASLADIGVEAGYSRGLPVQRFGTKLHLLETVIDTIQDRFMRQVERRIDGRTGCAALAERIRIQMEAVRDMPDSAIALYHLIVDSTGTVPELKPRIAELHGLYRDNLRAYLLQARKMGELRKDVDIEQNVRAISGAISGICIQALVSGDTKKLGEDAEFVAELFLDRLMEPTSKPANSGKAKAGAGAGTRSAPRRVAR